MISRGFLFLPALFTFICPVLSWPPGQDTVWWHIQCVVDFLSSLDSLCPSSRLVTNVISGPFPSSFPKKGHPRLRAINTEKEDEDCPHPCPVDEEIGRKLRWFITVWVRLLVSGEWEVEDEKWKVLCYFDVYLYPPWFRMVTRPIKETATRGDSAREWTEEKGGIDWWWLCWPALGHLGPSIIRIKNIIYCHDDN